MKTYHTNIERITVTGLLYIRHEQKRPRAIDLADQIRIFERKSKRILSEFQEILNILEFFPDSWFFDQWDKILFILKFSQDSFREERKKILVWTLKDSEYLVTPARFFYFWVVRQDSFHPENLVRSFFLSSRRESCLNIMIKKNHLW